MSEPYNVADTRLRCLEVAATTQIGRNVLNAEELIALAKKLEEYATEYAPRYDKNPLDERVITVR